jgi:formate dehydrogenase major subunit
LSGLKRLKTLASKSMASRRGFLRSASSVLVASTLLGSLVPAASGASIKSDVPPWVAQKMIRYKQGQQIPSVCAYCAGGCGILVTTLNGEVVEYEGDPYHPIRQVRTYRW